MAFESFSRFHKRKPPPPSPWERLRTKMDELEATAATLRESLAEVAADPSVYLYRIEKARSCERGAAKIRVQLGRAGKEVQPQDRDDPEDDPRRHGS